MGITEVLTAPQSPWQNGFVERLIGSIPRECLDHVIVLGEKHLRRILRSYFEYYQESRSHLSLGEDHPSARTVQPPEVGAVVEIAQVGGLHHRYERHAAQGALEHFVRRPSPTRSLPVGNPRLADREVLARQPIQEGEAQSLRSDHTAILKTIWRLNRILTAFWRRKTIDFPTVI